MWLLRNDEKGLLYRVFPGKQNIVSRKDGDLLLVGDQSISRKHALLFVDNDNASEGIVVKDLQSKYGTFTIVGEGGLIQLPPNQEITLKTDDCVKFGIQWNCWRVEFVPILVATSTLSQVEKTEVKELVASLGGLVVSEWQDKCTHLTMNKITVTVKVVCALAAGQPIVTPAYWRAFSQALSTMQTTLPNCKDFEPPLAEAMLNPSEVSFEPNPARGKLFSGYTFVASTAKQLTRIKPMINAAGGVAVGFSADSWSEQKFLGSKTVLMQHSANDKQGSQQSQVPDGYMSLARKLRGQGVRCIPESEIGLCVLNCSTSHYCNPRYNAQSLLGSISSLEATQPVNVVCPDTQETNSSENSTSVDAPASKGMSKKRIKEGHSENDDEELPSKKAKSRQSSEDIFSSQNISFQNTEKNPNLAVISRKDFNLKTSGDILSGDSKSLPKENKPLVVNPSLDMFAPSGERSGKFTIENVQNRSDLKPSCEDIFGSRISNSLNSKKPDVKKEFTTFSANRQTAVQKSPAKSDEENDEFSFPSKKRSRRFEVQDDVNDEFSFACSKRRKNEEKSATVNDEFSFSSDKKINKRTCQSSTGTRQSNTGTRQSNTDMFAQSADPLPTNSVAGPSKTREVEEDEFSFKGSKLKNHEESIFDFADGESSKRPNYNTSLFNKCDSEVEIALLSKKTKMVPNLIDLPAENIQSKLYEPQEESKLTTYSKNTTTSVNIKEDQNEEMDELVRELHNASIVVKPLIVAKPKPAEISAASNCTNFKKFHKVRALSKRKVPLIIGGSDLIVHTKEHEPDDFQLPPSPMQQTPEDDWTFLGDKKKGR